MLNIFVMLLIAIFSYLIGCVNASIVVTKLFDSGSDIREVGSGNAGFTNVLRTKGKKLAICTFAIDFAKGVLAVYLAQILMTFCLGLCGDSPIFCFGEYLACFSCVLGHVYTCFFGFKGGKAILTTWAATLLIDWRIFLVLISVFLVVLILSKIVSLASVCAALTFPVTIVIFYFAIDGNDSSKRIIALLFAVLISTLVIYRHRKNIQRILNGTESKITFHK